MEQLGKCLLLKVSWNVSRCGYVPTFQRNCCLHLQGRIKLVRPLSTSSCCPFYTSTVMLSRLLCALFLTETANARYARKRSPAAVSQEELQNYFRHFPTTSAVRLAILDPRLFFTKECEKLNALSVRCMQSDVSIIVVRLLKVLPEFYVTPKFISAFTAPHNWIVW